VRPGVLLVRASFVPTSALITLDFPTLDRPRKAISGTAGTGKCIKSLADNINRARIRIQTVSSVGVTTGKRREKISGFLKSERTFGMNVLFLDRMQSIPKRKSARDDQSNKNADQKKPPISRQHDQQNRHHSDRDHKPRRSLQPKSKPSARFRFHGQYSISPDGRSSRATRSATSLKVVSSPVLWQGTAESLIPFA